MNFTQTTPSHNAPQDLAAHIDRIFALQQVNRPRIGQTTTKERIAKLRRLHKALLAHRGEIREAMYRDFRKNPSEADLTEIYTVTSEIKHPLAHLKKWMKPHRVPTPLAFTGSRSYIHHDPKGVVLIISPWNYPVNLTFAPLVSAIAAGNCAMIKPSEYTPHASAVIRRIVEELFDEGEVAVIEGDHRAGAALLEKPFNHIFFTGSPQVGKIVMAAAARHLSSVTLELGGKSPVVVGKGANLKEVAQKVIWAKCINGGQTCVAPDYLYVHEDDRDKLLRLMQESLGKYYGESEEARATSPDFCRIVNDKHFAHVVALLEDARASGARIVTGGLIYAEERYVSPTILTDVPLDSAIMQEEIFGPLLPVFAYRSLQEPLAAINARPKALSLYVFSRDPRIVTEVLNSTASGTACVNDCAIQFSQSYLPFGGDNDSGIGKSRGFFGFEAFSNARAVLKQPTRWGGLQLLMPPYTKQRQQLIDLTIRWF